MKKAIKWILIIILVVGAVAGTAFLFFKNIKKWTTKTASIENFVYAESKENFDTNLENFSSALETNVSDTRFERLVSTNEKLNNMMETLGEYFIVSDGKISSNEIAGQISNVESARAYAQSTISQFNTKKQEKGDLFPQKLGANDVYVAVSRYLAQYALLIKQVDFKIADLGVDTKIDAKFAVIEVYVNVVINSFSSFKEMQYTEILNVETIDALTLVKIENGNFVTSGGEMFTTDCISFVEFYSKCDKQEFAKSFLTLKTTCSNLSDCDTDLKKAVHYFVLICGV